MRKIFLEQNPFYILEVSPNEKRASIISKAEEKAFFADGNECEEAQAKLLNPEKRLSAELDWFYEISIEKMADIHNCISESKEIAFDDLTGISRLNAVLHNFLLSNYDDYFELGYAILELDELYNGIDISELLTTINTNRQKSGLREVLEDELEREFNKKRDQIRQLVSDKTINLNEEDYIDFITMIAEKCIADEDYNDGVVISDIVDQYEIKIQDLIEEAADEIHSHIERIKELSNDEAIENNITGLIRRVEKWDRLVQPLQLKSMASGLPHRSSEEIGFEIRELALFLHNEKGLTEESLKLVDAMRDFFAELSNLAELFESDSNTLTEILEGGEEADEILAEMNELKTIAESINAYSPNIVIDNFITKFKALNQKIRNSSLNHDTKMTAREGVAYVGRGVALSLHNDHHKTEAAHRISIALSGEFGDVPGVGYKLKEDVTALNRELNQLSRIRAQQAEQERAENSKSIGCLVSIGIFFLILLLIGVSQCDSSDLSSSSSSSSSSSYGDSSYYNDDDDSDYSQTYTVTFDKQEGSGGSDSVVATSGQELPYAYAPTRSGYEFAGYYSEPNGTGTKYYDSNMHRTTTWDGNSDETIYAYWTELQPFSKKSTSGEKVYAEIVSIFPEIGIYTEGSLTYNDFVCKCKTSAGNTVWVYMSCDEYKSNFDSEASTSVFLSSAETVEFSSSKKVYGAVKLADAVMSDLSSDIDAEYLIEFDSVD